MGKEDGLVKGGWLAGNNGGGGGGGGGVQGKSIPLHRPIRSHPGINIGGKLDVLGAVCIPWGGSCIIMGKRLGGGAGGGGGGSSSVWGLKRVEGDGHRGWYWR